MARHGLGGSGARESEPGEALLCDVLEPCAPGLGLVRCLPCHLLLFNSPDERGKTWMKCPPGSTDDQPLCFWGLL